MTRKKPTEKGGSGQTPASGNANRLLTEEGSDIDKRLDEAFTQLEKESDDIPSSNSGSKNSQTSNTGSVSTVTENKANTDGSTKSGAGLIVSFGMLISILALVVAGYAAYLIYESNSELKEARTSVRSLETELANLKRTSDQKIEQLSVVLEQTTASISQIREVENTAIADLGASFEVATEQLRTELRAELNEGLGTSGEDWLLAEVEYLIRLANQRVLMERDVSGALSLLSSADEIVEQTTGIAAYELRESLAYDIANLKAVSDLDTDGIFLSLSAMASQVTELRRKRPELSPTTQIQIDNGEAQNSYQQFLSLVNNIFGRVLNSVDYRRDGVAITPLLPPKEEYYLRQNLILKFEMAQLALLRNDQPVYHTSLSEAKLWIVKHFVETDPRTVALVTALDQLVEVEVDRSLPNISGSLRAVRGLLNTLHQQDSRGAGK
ncbi:uroporphyrinogen-III C-methyltransferase [Pseudomonadales bacterium]|jgi:uroporphyrin-3 C-methyltransferase|nr:uroporphyrinogen-III C-methyltransferase [Pseudomonadales bacterium]MDC1018019.1 uroporphyrinogen-III C-methyltransferase [Pseudomonadales bacterium]